MARTADIHVRARRGNTTQELQRDALLRDRESNLMKWHVTPQAITKPPFNKAFFYVAPRH